VQLTENRRQRDPIERAALSELRDGEVARGVGLFGERGRVHEHASTVDARDQIVSHWCDEHLDGRDALMIASTRAAVDDLNRRARAQLITERVLPREHIVIHGREFAVGDHVITLHNDYRWGLLNGLRGTVTEADPKQGKIVVAFDNGWNVAIPDHYFRAGWLDHAYAMTIHKAQGLTCDVALVLGDDHLYREAGYTALSRGRLENHLYVDVDDPDAEAHAPRETRPQVDAITQSLTRSRRRDLGITMPELLEARLPRAVNPPVPEPELDVEIDL
jgi:ATP-dependent exoDNAse (exonuclease V) alpha subunit